MKTKKIKWTKPQEWALNTILDGKDFYISYNPQAGAPIASGDLLMDSIGNMAQLLGGSIIGEVEPQEETALTDRITDKYYILKGDFRKEFEEAFPKGFKACLAVFNRHKKEFESNWSNY